MKTIFALIALCSFAFGANLDHSNNRIVGGEEAVLGQFPYIVSIRRISEGSHACGGTILNKRTVVTAAHCNFGSRMVVVVGSTRITDGGVEHSVSQVIEHPEWNPVTLENDVAVFILNDDIEFNENVQPIPLASSNIGGNVEVITSGWGFLSYPGSTPNNLQWINTKTISKEECQALHEGYLFESQICTLTKEGEGVCSGDSGGPLVLDGELVGITSAAYLCALGLPDFFTRVYSFRSWIEANSA